MSIDPKAFGLSNSLVGAVNEALKGGQKKLDKNHNGKLDAQDFKMLRKEDKEKEQAVANEQTPGDYAKINYKHKMMKEVADANKANFKANMKEGPEEKDATNPKQGSSVDPKKRSIGEAAAVGGPGAADQMAAKKDALQSQIQRKIAQKQMQNMQAKANKRLSNMKEGDSKKNCGCTESMKCESHSEKNEKETKGGKEVIVMNPPLKESGELPKKVITKGHEIAKSLIKHRAKVKSPYAVGMATAKKSAGIKEDAEQVDEISTMKAIRTAVKRQTNAYGDAIQRGDDLSDKEKHKVNRSQALIKKKYGEKGDKIVYKAVGKRIGYQD